MVVLVDILHPAHVHFFAPIRTQLLAQGHRVIVTVRDKEIAAVLLQRMDIPFTLISRQKAGLRLIGEMLIRTGKLLRICRKEKPDLLMGIMGPSIAVAGKILRISAWVFYDTENAWITNWFAYPLAERIYTPECYGGKTRGNQIRYPGYHELSYLHPSRFEPSRTVLQQCGLKPDDPFIVVRFVGWAASHDIGEKGLTADQKRAIVSTAATFGKVYITSESKLPADLAQHALPGPPEIIHHVLAFARLFIGESATMASEACVLGTQAVFISDTGRGYTTEQEQRYGLVRCFTRRQLGEALSFVKHNLSDAQAGGKTKRAHQQLLAERIDVTEYVMNQIHEFMPKKSCSPKTGDR